MKLKFRYYILLILFFLTLITSLYAENIYVLFLFSAMTWVVLPFKKWWDRISISLLFFSLFYCLILYLNGEVNSWFIFFSTLIAPSGFYRFGRWLMLWLTDDKERIKFFFWFTLSYLIPLFLLTIQDMLLVGIINDSRAMLSDSLKGDTTLSATIYGLMSSVGIGAISMIFARNIEFKVKVGLIGIGIFSILVVIHLVNRTGLVISGFCLLFAFAYVTRLKINKLIPALFVLFLLFAFVAMSGIISSDIISAYAQREIDASSNTAELGGRTELWIYGIENLLTHPFGWKRQHYAHNLWLDMTALGGWLPLFCFLIATCATLKNFVSVLRRRMNVFSLLLLNVTVSMFLNSMVEPVMEGSLLFFVLFMMMWGILQSESRELLYLMKN